MISQAYFDRLAQIESRNNPYAKNPKSTAKGRYQFIDKTAKQYGITAEFGTPDYERQETEAVKRFNADNYRALKKKLGRDPKEGELYLAHQQGAGGALKLLSNPTGKAVDTLGLHAVKNNGGDENMTNQEFANKWISKFEQPETSTIESNFETTDSGKFGLQTALTPEEQKELEQLEAEFGETESINKLTPQEQAELDALEAELGEVPTDTDTAAKETPKKSGLGRTLLDQGLQGATFGLGDEISDALGAAGAGLILGENPITLYKQGRSETQDRLDTQLEERPVPSIAAQLGAGVLTGAAGATTKAGGALGSFLRTGNAPARIAKGAAVGATSGGLYGLGSGKDGERAESAGQGALIGGVAGGAIPAVAATVSNALIPKIDDAIKPLAKRAREMGIPLRADQVSPTRVRQTIQKVSQEIPFSGADAFEDSQRQAWTKALAKTIGQNSDDLGPEAVEQFIEDAAAKFDDHLKGETIKIGRDTFKKLDDIIIDAEKTIDDSLANIVRKNIDDVRMNVAGEEISGEKLSSVRSELLRRSVRAQGGAKQYLSDAIEALDDAIEKSVSKPKANSLKQARREWRNFKTIEPLLEESTDGQVDPTKLLSKVKASKYIKASRKKVGEDDLIDLARIGKRFLPKRGGSDTIAKAAMGSGAVGLIGTTMANPVLGGALAAKAAAGVGINRAIQRGVLSNQKFIDRALNDKALRLLHNPAGRLGAAAGALTNE